MLGVRAGCTGPACGRRSRQLREAVRCLIRSPVRSALIATGVGASIGALLVAETVAERARLDTMAEIGRIGANVLIVSAKSSENRGGRARTGAVVTTLSHRDATRIVEAVPGVLAVAGEYRAPVSIKVGDLVREASASGVDASYARVSGARMAYGRFFDEDDAKVAGKVVVLGASLARDLFAGAGSPDSTVDPVGQTLWLQRIPFRVIGVLAARGVGLDAFDEDAVAFVPLRTAQQRLFRVDYVQRIFVRVDEARASLDGASRSMAELLIATHRVNPSTGVPDFRVDNQQRLVDIRAASARRLRVFEAGIAILLLGSGAGGTFALQHHTVRDRTVEIGTRRALGATAPDVFIQFLIEASVASMGGAMAGLGTAWAVALLLRTKLIPGLAPAVLVVCVASCIAAACVPAWLAARTRPAVSLRAS